ncbi:Uma2 family endonuclease [soil metagenome]
MQVISVENLVPAYIPKDIKSVRLHFEFEDEKRKMTPDEFWKFCNKNPKLNAELTKEGDIIIMPPTGWNTTKRNAKVIRRLGNWAEKNGEGEFSESNGGFILPNGATRSPDAAWVLKSRLETLPAEALEKFLPLCPDFVIEMTSPSDSLSETQSKMAEYIENGAQLGWLIHSKTKQVFIYRPNQEVEILENPTKVSGESLLTGFELDLTEIW